MTHVLDTHIPSRQIYLHSDTGLSLHSGGGEHIFQFDSSIHVANNMHCLVSLVSASIPNTQYTINSNNDKLAIDSEVFNLTHGFYNVDTLSAYLSATLTNITVTHSLISGKFTFTKTSGDFTIQNTSTCSSIIGLNSLGQTSASSILICDNICNLMGLTDAYVQILGLHNENTKNHCAGRVNIDCPVGEVAHTISHYKFAVSNHLFQHYHIRLIDQHGNICDLNKIPYSLTIQLDFIYNKEFKEDLTLEAH